MFVWADWFTVGAVLFIAGGLLLVRFAFKQGSRTQYWR
jgi:hypothetical protein